MGYVRVKPPKDYADLSPGQRMAFWREAILDAIEHPVATVRETLPADVVHPPASPDPARTPAVA